MSAALEQLIQTLQKHADQWEGGADQELVNLYFTDLRLRTERPKMEEQLAVHQELTDEYKVVVVDRPDQLTEVLTAERNSLREKQEQLVKVLHPSNEDVEKHTKAFLEYLGKVGDQLDKQKAILKMRVAENKVAVNEAAEWLTELPNIREFVEKARTATDENAVIKQEISGLKREIQSGSSAIASPAQNQ